MSKGFFWRTRRTEISRLRRIVEVLIRNGLGFLVENTGLGRFISPWRARRVQPSAQAAGLTIPQRVRRTLEELGPTYIKLGQLIAPWLHQSSSPKISPMAAAAITIARMASTRVSTFLRLQR